MVIYRKSGYYSEPNDPVRESELAAETGVSSLLVRALSARGASTKEQIERFLNPSAEQFHDPFLLNDMDRAVDRIKLALDTAEKICIFGDYDVDGICATAMLTDYFRSVGANVCYHIPLRTEEGYGMSIAAVERLYEQGVGLIITVDNGISAVKEIAYCRELGIDVIVTDHHIPPETLPDCIAVVSHTAPNSRYPSSILCGAGTAFKLLHALSGLDAAMKYVSLAGLASVADVVPLVDENRVFVKLGLAAINEGRCCIGLTRLLESIPTAKRPYNTCNLGFAVAPRLNASGRMKDASLSVELFLSAEPSRIDGMIEELNRLNELRQRDEAEILADALELLKGQDLSLKRALVLFRPEWNGGVIGSAASRILETFHRPTILICETNGVLKGSARSIDGVNIHDALNAVKDCFIRFGGHAKAAGITLERERLEEFERRLDAYLAESYPASAFAACKEYEFELPVDAVNEELIAEFSRLAPFGEGNPSPVFRSRGCAFSRLRRFGNDSQHTRIDISTAKGPLEAVWFGSSAFFSGLLAAESLDIIHTPAINHWCGSEGVQLRVKWAQPQPPEDIPAFLEHGMCCFCDSLNDASCFASDEAGGAACERSELSLSALFSRRLSGTLALAFSPEGANAALTELEREGLNVDICFGAPPASPVCDNALVIAPVISRLSAGGYGEVLLVDEPPFDVLPALEKRLGSPRIVRLAAKVGVPSGNAAFSEVALRFSVEREFMTECYSGAMCALKRGCPSFEELALRLSERTNAPRYCARFALHVFMELGFIRQNERGSLEAGDIVPSPLTASRLYSTVLDMRSSKLDPSGERKRR